MTTAEIIEQAADVIEREGYDPAFYYSPCDGTYCQGGAIAAVVGAKPSGSCTNSTVDQYALIEEAMKILHPELRNPWAAVEPWYQMLCYKSREDVVRHMREVAAELTEQEQAQEPAYA